MKKHEHIVKSLMPGGIGEELGIEPGDKLLAINGNEIQDVFDYYYYEESEQLLLLIEKPDGEEWELEIEKDEDESLGIEFDQSLMDEYRSCRNKCMFCFIDQMPKGMRETLYFKDDDSRLYCKVPSGADQYFVPDDESRTSLQDAAQPVCGRGAEKSRYSLPGTD